MHHRFGGSYVPETLVAALTELEKAYQEIQKDPSFQARGNNCPQCGSVAVARMSQVQAAAQLCAPKKTS